MTIYQVDEHYLTHTCPGNPEPHVIDSQRGVAAITPGGECRTPVTVRCGHTTVTLPCGRVRPNDQRCPACRVIVTIGQTSTDHLGHDHGHTHTDSPTDKPTESAIVIPNGCAPDPCTTCGEPLATILAPYRRHLLCRTNAAASIPIRAAS